MRYYWFIFLYLCIFNIIWNISIYNIIIHMCVYICSLTGVGCQNVAWRWRTSSCKSFRHLLKVGSGKVRSTLPDGSCMMFCIVVCWYWTSQRREHPGLRRVHQFQNLLIVDHVFADFDMFWNDCKSVKGSTWKSATYRWQSWWLIFFLRWPDTS